jgi:pimeloyl-ACP methyl ester carboxylesterase
MSILRRHSVVVLVAAACAVAAHATIAGAQAVRTPDAKGYANVNGVDLYYEVHGDGPPLVMLHGGVIPGEMFGAPLTEMAKMHRVIAPHARGHGLSKDTSQPWSHEAFADDVAALLERLGIKKASVMGYSSGGAVALQTAIRHPDLVDKVVIISTPFRSDGYYPEGLQRFAEMPAAAPKLAASVSQSPLAALYPSVNWESMFRKTGELANRNRGSDWSASVAGIKVPTLLVFADADAIRPAHIAEFYKLLGGGQRDAGLDGSLRPASRLAVVPNTTHYNILGAPSVTLFATEFLKSQ